ncbi:hypothetical protein R6Q59_019258 [Mikania micrantha]
MGVDRVVTGKKPMRKWGDDKWQHILVKTWDQWGSAGTPPSSLAGSKMKFGRSPLPVLSPLIPSFTSLTIENVFRWSDHCEVLKFLVGNVGLISTLFQKSTINAHNKCRFCYLSAVFRIYCGHKSKLFNTTHGNNDQPWILTRGDNPTTIQDILHKTDQELNAHYKRIRKVTLHNPQLRKPHRSR